MNDSTNRLSELFESGDKPNQLWRYVQSMSPEAVAQLSKPESMEVMQVMERNINGLLGGLPADQFDIAVTTSRESLGRLMASAMMSGYFLRNAEQRMSFEQSFQGLETLGLTSHGMSDREKQDTNWNPEAQDADQDAERNLGE